MKKNILLLKLFVLSIGCSSDQDGCEALETRKDVACIEIYSPVCGCNNRTYSNSCKAEAWGIEDYTEGECGTSTGSGY